MAKPTPEQAGREFLKRVAERLPEDQREVFLATAMGNPEVLAEVGNGALRHEDYSRIRNEQTQWWNTNQSELDRLRQAAGERDNSNGNNNGNGNGNLQRREEPVDPRQRPITLAEALEVEARTIDLQALQSTLVSRHWAEFQEPLDVTALVKKAREESKPLPQVYDETVSERRKTVAQAKYDADLKAAEERGRQAGRQEAIGQKGDLPFPVGSSAPTTLSGLRPVKEGETRDVGVDAAVHTLIEQMNRANA